MKFRPASRSSVPDKSNNNAASMAEMRKSPGLDVKGPSGSLSVSNIPIEQSFTEDLMKIKCAI
jgi:hypothetical protein